jgi:hypothetical protein
VARRGSDTEEDEFPFLTEGEGEEPRQLAGQVGRWALAFALLFGGVFFCFWWSGSAIRFGAARVGEQPQPTWKVFGVVRSAESGGPVAWASIADDPGGRPPYFRTESDFAGGFTLMTLAEPHTLRVQANGFRPLTVAVGRQWFIWWPRGEEKRDIQLIPESPDSSP